jgi:hypothetical protein
MRDPIFKIFTLECIIIYLNWREHLYLSLHQRIHCQLYNNVITDRNSNDQKLFWINVNKNLEAPEDFVKNKRK